MKVLFSDTTFSYLFPGGKQVHAEKLYTFLKEIDVDVEYENWYDPKIKGEIVHFFGFNDFNKIKALKNKGYKLIYTHIMDGLTNQSKSKLFYHSLKNKLINLLPHKFNAIFPWKALDYFDAIVYMHENDRNTAVKLYNIDKNKTYIIPHAVDSLDKFKGDIHNTEKFLVSVGSIVERKNIITTSNLCIKNNIPLKIIGHPFDKNSTYFKSFISLIKNTNVEYLGFLCEEEKLETLKKAAGFVLLSKGESGCISVYEAAATGLPLLLSDLPWAKGYENPKNINYCSIVNLDKASKTLNDFFENCNRENCPTFTVHTWKEISEMYKKIYKSILVV